MSMAEKLTDARDCPSVDDVYESYIREQLGHSPLEGVTDQQFVGQVVKCFREAPIVVCSRAIGEWINNKLGETNWTQQDLAKRVGVDRSAVAYWTQDGKITLGNLAQVLIAFKSQWSDLPIPARQEMAVEAYLAALTYFRKALGGEQPVKPLDRERFWCLYHILSEPRWWRALLSQDACKLREEAERIANAVEKSLAHKPQAAVNVAFLLRLVEEWGRAWFVCIKKVPRWATR
jgi:transcriptional regulator with XRE-family HTH domain